jgi:hypothetical protein
MRFMVNSLCDVLVEHETVTRGRAEWLRGVTESRRHGPWRRMDTGPVPGLDEPTNLAEAA